MGVVSLKDFYLTGQNSKSGSFMCKICGVSLLIDALLTPVDYTSMIGVQPDALEAIKL
jgi:hypothetical protein